MPLTVCGSPKETSARGVVLAVIGKEPCEIAVEIVFEAVRKGIGTWRFIAQPLVFADVLTNWFSAMRLSVARGGLGRVKILFA